MCAYQNCGQYLYQNILNKQPYVHCQKYVYQNWMQIVVLFRKTKCILRNQYIFLYWYKEVFWGQFTKTFLATLFSKIREAITKPSDWAARFNAWILE